MQEPLLREGYIITVRICFVLGFFWTMGFSVWCSCVSSSSCSEIDWLFSLPVQGCAPHMRHRGYWKKDKYKMVSMGLSSCEFASVQDCHAPKTTFRYDRPACLQIHMWALPRCKWSKVSLLQKLDVQPLTMRRWKYEVNITTPAKRLSSTITRELGSQLANTKLCALFLYLTSLTTKDPSPFVLQRNGTLCLQIAHFSDLLV